MRHDLQILDDPDAVATHAAAEVVPMQVTDADLEAAAGRYAEPLPARFDLLHLGLGPDGHTASLVPGDPVLTMADRLVALTQPYQGRPRMTLTYPALARADQLLWLITGSSKRTPLRKLLAGDPSIPAGRVEAARSYVLADKDAAGS
jgi:6-phosphogluconolactonase